MTTTPSIRTPLSRVRYLGAAHSGTGHFWRQRLTGIANVPLAIGLVVILTVVLGKPYPEALAVLSHPLAALILLGLVISAAVHMRIGMQVIIEDYVHDGAKLVAVIANNLFCCAIGLAGVYAILKIALARLV
jgi:succinate dehydrogenase / fumarate reductase membrane anchor subunit